MAYEASVPQAQPARLRNPSMGMRPAYLKHSLRDCAIRAWATQRTSSTACAPAQSEHGLPSVPQAQPARLRNPSMGYPAYIKHSLRTCAIRAWATQRTSSTACATAQSEHGLPSVPQAQPAHLRNPSMGYPAYLKHSLRDCAIRAWATQRTSSTACATAQSEHGYEASVPQARPAHLRNPSMGMRPAYLKHSLRTCAIRAWATQRTSSTACATAQSEHGLRFPFVSKDTSFQLMTNVVFCLFNSGSLSLTDPLLKSIKFMHLLKHLKACLDMWTKYSNLELCCCFKQLNL
ncbi:hypothetical protein DPMN_012741 [Dreissena polymorpha]|uniref:Uncharacterized protein n=1 Tax=Dreissena polymorpha TaxID=45954 RepID=A0A9D4N6E5_DREPO|nr:hypothetical protein DPMN_012741 [Dreissena polymorpha]